jgi:hypothetical protein
MKLRRRWSAALLGLGVAGLLTAAVSGAVGPGQRAAAGSAPSAAVGGGTCQEWMCGTNHHQVLL